ncbi:uncharacterized protein CEXT_370861 [Caerostris extrusa]|uniref:Uncharacterized protein n=1 Tax=Caerostris extrusa TaxID=172846 RepID=A0AAV4XC78_CAEEX|nr:uncharacterized protein CEXT_370861 [Caerostris extrusa]
MEKGRACRSCLPPGLTLKADSLSTQCSEIIEHFSTEIAQAMAPKSVVRDVDELGRQICRYHLLALTLGTCADGTALRQELLERQQVACRSVVSVTAQLSHAFRRAESIPRKEVEELERSCRVLVACVHTLDRELRRTLHLYRVFPLAPDPDGARECHFIQTGVTDLKKNQSLQRATPLHLNATPTERFFKEMATPLHFDATPIERFFKERDSWLELEDEILKVHDLDVELHRDDVLGPILDYLTLCPKAGHLDPARGRALTHRFVPSQGDPGSKVSLDETSDLPDGYCDEETLFRKSSNLFCYIAAILAVACIGGGVLMGVIFMMIQ